MTPPPVLDSARVLEYAVVDASVVFTGKLHLYRGDKRVGAVPHLAICQDQQTNELMLFHCDADWNVVGVQAWNAPGIVKPASVQEMKERAEGYYTGLAKKWSVHPASPEEARAYYEANYCTDRCSFCQRSMHEVRFLVSGDNGARICNHCIEKFRREIGPSFQEAP